MKDFDLFELFSTQIYDHKIDFLLHQISFNVIAQDVGIDKYYKLIFSGVQNIQYKNISECCWKYAELGEIYIKEKDDMFAVRIDMWGNKLDIVCKDYEIKLVAEEKG